MNNGFRELMKETRDRLESATQQAFEETLEVLGAEAEGATGGTLRMFLCFDEDSGYRGWHESHTRRLGTRKDEEAWEKADITGTEKSIRLAKWFSKSRAITSSWVTRNTGMWEYGGAIIIKANIPDFGGWVYILLSFSGLPEVGDETLVLRIAERMGWKNEEVFANILRVSGQPYYAKLPAVA